MANFLPVAIQRKKRVYPKRSSYSRRLCRPNARIGGGSGLPLIGERDEEHGDVILATSDEAYTSTCDQHLWPQHIHVLTILQNRLYFAAALLMLSISGVAIGFGKGAWSSNLWALLHLSYQPLAQLIVLLVAGLPVKALAPQTMKRPVKDDTDKDTTWVFAPARLLVAQRWRLLPTLVEVTSIVGLLLALGTGFVLVPIYRVSYPKPFTQDTGLLILIFVLSGLAIVGHLMAIFAASALKRWSQSQTTT